MRNQRRSVSQLSLDYPLLGSALALVRDADAWWAEKGCLLVYRLHLRPQRRGQDGQLGRDPLGGIHLDDPRLPYEDRPRAQSTPFHPSQGTAGPSPRTDRPQREQNFPPRRGGEYIGNDRLSRLLRKLEIPTVPSGFRISFRNWAGGRADIAQPVAEMVLARYPTDPVMKALMTSDFFKERQTLMQEWANVLTETMGPVIPTIRT